MRLRLRYTKRGKIRFTSHRDTARVWERTVRRAQLPIAYSQGFSPHAKLSFGLALSTGFESDAEYLDIELDQARADVDVAALPSMLSGLLPDGMTVSAVAVLPVGAPSLQQIVTSCEYVIDLSIDDFVAPDTVGALGERVALAVARVNAADSVFVARERKGVVRNDDIRPAILALEYQSDGMVRLRAELAAQPKAVRPSELLAALAVDAVARVRRTHQWTLLEGLRSEPLRADQFGDVAGSVAASSAGTFAAAGAVMGRCSPDHHAGTTALVSAVREEFFDVRSRGLRLDRLRQAN
ncbi:MAG TPA: TIGR03936 family radical SAM-associated protein [Acidimicrobiales bacterium]|nr:TIGR03936 family radical SAM-associated protein [Acidimicrobiales bacterium]